MRLLEDTLKPLLAANGITVPVGLVVRHERELGRFVQRRKRVVLKALVETNDRASSGLIAIVTEANAAYAFSRLSALGHRVWAEEVVDHDFNEYFIGLLWLGHQENARLIVSENAGSGFEARAKSSSAVQAYELLARQSISNDALPLLGATKGMAELANSAHAVFEQIGGIAFELNPVVRDKSGRLVPLDAKAFVDPYAPGRLGGSTSGQAHEPLLEFSPLLGQVGLLSIGAGLTHAVIDWLHYCGPGAACFSDLIPAVLADAQDLLAGQSGSQCVRSTAWLCNWLQAVNRDRLLVTLVSGGTPIDALSRSVATGIKTSVWSGKTVAFVAGNRASMATDVWKSSGIQCAPTLADAIELAYS